MTGLPYKRTTVKFFGILAVSLLLGGGFLPSTALALDCVEPEEVISGQLAEDSPGLVFTGTVTEVRETSANLTEVTVAVETAYKGDVPAVVQIAYSYSEDWGYGCSSEPDQVGDTRTLFVYSGNNGLYTSGLALVAGSKLHNFFLNELETQRPTGTIVATTTVSNQPTLSFWQRVISAFENFWNGLFGSSKSR